MEAKIDKKVLNVFKGEDAIARLINPDENPYLPLVELPEGLNPYKADGVRIYAKLMFMLPLLNVKSLPTMNMLMEAKARGKLDGVHTIVENSSGNTAFSLGILAKVFGVKNVWGVVSANLAIGKLQLLKLAGVKTVLYKDENGIEKARKMGQEAGFINLGQYGNEDNPAAFERWIAPQIWDQTDGGVSVVCSGMGTGGTIIGLSRYFKKRNPNVKAIGVEGTPESDVPGVRTEEKLKEVTLPWKQEIDKLYDVNMKDSFEKSIELCRAGIMAGPSAGFALTAMLRYIKEQKDASKLDELRNKDGEIVCVFICSDSPLPYLDMYLEYTEKE